jgi:uncharacterized membrane protein YhiD involved in acid resistance
MKNHKLLGLIGISLVLVAIILAVSYFLANRLIFLQTETTTVAATENKNAAQPTPNTTNAEIPFFSQMLPAEESTPVESWSVRTAQTIIRLLLAVLLSAILAFRPRKNVPLFQRNLYVAQTQILLAVVAAALMMIVGDNTARAFAIFAAVSLVRFRTNIRDPKEITVLLISLSLGLAAGVGRWELGLTLCLFVLVLLWILEFNESDKVFRSMELTVKTKNTDITQNILKDIFSKHNLEAEVRQLNPPDEKDPIGSIMYYLNLRLNVSTDRLSDNILASDAENIEGIQWKQQKSVSYV